MSYTLKDLKFEFDLDDAFYEIDALQNEILQFYLRADNRFRQAFHTNFTSQFIQFMKDKAKLNEPFHLSIMGQVRCQPKDSKVLMSNGKWKAIQDIRLHDKVITIETYTKKTRKSKIIGLSQHLSKENYEFYEMLTHKKLFTCSSEHQVPTISRELGLSYHELTAKQLYEGNQGHYLIKYPDREEIMFYMKKSKPCVVYGIELDSSSKLYITDNMIITHNSGKSYSALSICAIHSLLNGKKFTTQYICGNKFDFVERLKLMDEKDLNNSIFLIDEDKRSVYGIGSIAKKMKLTDVQNIIAINNISTVSLTPDQWSNEQAFYGLRAFGRCFKTKTVRFMLYNLQGGGNQGETPLGMVYMPIFTQLLPKKHAEELEKDYLEVKNQWVNAEMRSESDVLGEIKRKRAEELLKDEQYLSLTKKDMKITYISQILGSESTSGEIKEIYNIAELLKRNITFDKPKDN